MEYLYFIAGLIVLFISGDYLVKGGVALASRFGVSTLVIGLTVVAFGTSAPELIVSLNAAVNGHPEIAIGNVIGSNIANIALVLAVTAIIIPIPVKRVSVLTDWPVMMVSFILLYVFLLNNTLENWEGALMFSLLIVFIVFSITKSRKTSKKANNEIKKENIRFSAAESIGLIILSSLGLYIGVNWLIDEGAVPIARNFGMSERVISVTIIAFGTSVPELTASLIGAFKKETDISIGNIIGSNIFNVFAVLGLTSIIKPIDIDISLFNFDIISMLVIAVMLFLFIFPFKTVYLKRWEAVVLFMLYLSYIISVSFF